MKTLRIDLETYSPVDLKKCGVHKYVEPSEFEILLFAYAYDDQPVTVIDLAQGEQIPRAVLADLRDPEVTKTAYNAAFEIACLSKHMAVQLEVEQWRCTSVHALYLGMPGNLADVGKVIGLTGDKQKMNIGWSLIRYFCIPCKPTKKNGERTRNLPHHDPAKWQLFIEYCRRDVETEREVARRIAKFPVPDKEWRLWFLDQKMNTRGIQVDVPLIHAAIECDAIVKQRLMEEAMAITGLSNPNSRTQLLDWLNEELEDGEELSDVKKKTVAKLLEGKPGDVIERVLALRQELAKTSVSKFHAMARAVGKDHRIRGLTQFYGANRTGRWAGRLVQVQNLPQNKLRDLDLARNLLREREYELLELMFGTVPDTLSQLIRTAFVAGTGSRFVVADFSAIEARVIAWLAWCQWRLDVFATHGMIYEASASTMFKVPIESIQAKVNGKKVKGPNYGLRQKGKIAELALGYQGGAGALKTMGALDMGIAEEELDPIKVAWREANPEIVKLWYAMERVAKQAVQNKTSVTLPIAGGRTQLVFAYESGFLTIRLPSGRKLFYVKPRIEAEDLYRETSNGGRYVVASAGSLTYEGTDQKTKQWTRLATYGGKLVENVTQAIARDCLAESMLLLDDRGFDQCMTVHDEDVLEVPHGLGELAEVEEIMGRPIAWAPDLLLRADGFETSYYMKEID